MTFMLTIRQGIGNRTIGVVTDAGIVPNKYTHNCCGIAIFAMNLHTTVLIFIIENITGGPIIHAALDDGIIQNAIIPASNVKVAN